MRKLDNQNSADSAGPCYCKNPAVYGGSIKKVSKKAYLDYVQRWEKGMPELTLKEFSQIYSQGFQFGMQYQEAKPALKSLGYRVD